MGVPGPAGKRARSLQRHLGCAHERLVCRLGRSVPQADGCQSQRKSGEALLQSIIEGTNHGPTVAGIDVSSGMLLVPVAPWPSPRVRGQDS